MVATTCSPACLHCAISVMLLERERLGLAIAPREIGKICEVIGDIAASIPDQGPQVFQIARDLLNRFERDIAAGTYSAGRELIGADGAVRKG
jgi:hypothetical protein